MKRSLVLLGLMAFGNISKTLFYSTCLFHVVASLSSDTQHTHSDASRQPPFDDAQGVIEPPQYLIDLYSGTIEYVGSKLEGASRVVAVALSRGVTRQNSNFFVSFKRPEVYRIRSVKLALTKLSYPSIRTGYYPLDNSSTKAKDHVLSVFRKKSGAEKRDRFQSIFKSRNYDIFNVTEICTKLLEDSESDDMLEFNIAFHRCCGENPSWVGDVYQLASKRTDSPLLLFYDDISTAIWNNSVVQVGMSERNDFVRDGRSIRSVRRVYQPPCKLRNWVVKIEDLGWSNMYAPTSFQVNYCWGKCRFLGNVNIKTTNHALIKYLFRNNREQRKRKKGIINKIGKMKWACCAPDQFQSIDVIYQESDGTITFAELDNVKAVSCGCH